MYDKPGMGTARKISELMTGLLPLQLIRAWKECAGPALLSQTKFMGVLPNAGHKTLMLEVPDPLWRQELEFQKEEILQRYRDALRRSGCPDAEMPTRCSLGPVASLPFKTINAQKSRGKKRIE
jgi:hypothetical protein